MPDSEQELQEHHRIIGRLKEHVAVFLSIFFIKHFYAYLCLKGLDLLEIQGELE
jgi:hypothetical protein